VRRVAVVSDIHGNLPALEAVLGEIEAESVDAVMCCGDTLGGPFPVEVFERLAVLPDVRYVRGNADRFVLEGTDEFGEDWAAERERMGEERLAAAATWPLTQALEIDGLGRTLFFHAIPTADEPIFTKITPDEDVAQLIGDVDAHLAVVGHTHVQFDRTLANGLRIVNGGSVGMPYEGRPGAYWALLGPGVEHRRTEYDLDDAERRIRAGGGPFADLTMELLRVPPTRAEAIEHAELRGFSG
jgi:putative phosphoesterase